MRTAPPRERVSYNIYKRHERERERDTAEMVLRTAVASRIPNNEPGRRRRAREIKIHRARNVLIDSKVLNVFEYDDEMSAAHRYPSESTCCRRPAEAGRPRRCQRERPQVKWKSKQNTHASTRRRS